MEESCPSLYHKLENLISNSSYDSFLGKTRISSVKAFSDDELPLVEVFLKHLEHVKNAHAAYKDFLASSIIYELGDVDVDMHRYQYWMERIREKDASVPVLLYAMIDQARSPSFSTAFVFLTRASSQICRVEDPSEGKDDEEYKQMASLILKEEFEAIKTTKEFSCHVEDPSDFLLICHVRESRSAKIRLDVVNL